MGYTTANPKPGAPVTLDTLVTFFVVFKSNMEVEMKVILENQARILALLEQKTTKQVWEEMQQNLQKEKAEYLEENFKALGFKGK